MATTANQEELKTTVRLHPDYETDNPWGGKSIDVALTGPVDMITVKLETIASLWFFQFLKGDSNTIYQYFGVLDFDFKRVLAKADKPPTKAQLLEDEDIKRIIHLLDEKFSHFTVYFSGRKGIHVYVYSKEMFVYPPPDFSEARGRLNWLHSFLNATYGTEIYDLLDASIYHIGKGIRPYSMAHPKTGIRPFMIYQKGPHNCIWSYLLEEKPWETTQVFIPEINALIQKKVCERTMKTGISEVIRVNSISESSTDMTKSVIDYLKNQPGSIPSNPVKLVKSSGKCKNLYKVLNTSYCPIKRGCHSRTGKSYVYIYSHHATFMCFSDTCGTESEYTLKKYLPPLTNLTELSNTLFDRGEIRQKHFEAIVIPPEQKYVSVHDIEWAIGNEDVGKYGYIAAPMSCGKTTALRAYLEAQPPSYSCLLIVVRQSQAHTFAPIYPGMANYLDCKPGSLFGVNRLVICINSLMRILSVEGFVRSYDLLMLDEFESDLDVSTNPSMSNGRSMQTEIWETLIALIKCCKRTLFMDGIPTDISLKYLDRIGILPFVRIVEMPRQVDYRTYIMYSHAQIFIETFEEKIRNGKKIVLVSNCKAILQTIFDEIHVPSGNKMIITGDSDRDIKLTSSNPDLYWNKDLFAFNSAVGPGTSFNPKLYDEMGVIVTPNSSSPQVLFQMINRIRELNDKVVRVIILDGNATNIPTREELKRRKMQNIVNMQNKQTIYPKAGFFQKMDKEYCRLTILDLDHKIAKELVSNQMMKLKHEDDLFLDMLVEYEYRKRVLENSEEYAKQLFLLIRRNGGIVREEINPIKKVIETSTRMLKSDARNHELKRTLDLKNNVIWTIPEKYASKFTEVALLELNKKVPRNDADAHYMWIGFRKAFLHESEQSLYEKEFFQIIAQKKAVNNTILFSNGLMDEIKKLCDICSISISSKTAIVSGKVRTSMEFFNNDIGEINNICERALEMIRCKTQFTYRICKPDNKSVTKANRSTLLNVQTLFNCFGIHSEYRSTAERLCTGRKKGERFVRAFLVFDEDMQKFRMAISKLDPETGESDMEAYEKVFPKLFASKI